MLQMESALGWAETSPVKSHVNDMKSPHGREPVNSLETGERTKSRTRTGWKIANLGLGTSGKF